MRGVPPASQKFAHPPIWKNPPPVDSPSPNFYLPFWHQRLIFPHQITIFMLKSNKSNKTCIFNCSHSSSTIFILSSFSLYTQVIVILFWCSVITECCFYPWKSSDGKIHSSDFYHSIKKYHPHPPAKFLTIFSPPPPPPSPLNTIWKTLLLFLLPCFVDWMSDCTTYNVLFYLMSFLFKNYS